MCRAGSRGIEASRSCAGARSRAGGSGRAASTFGRRLSLWAIDCTSLRAIGPAVRTVAPARCCAWSPPAASYCSRIQRHGAHNYSMHRPAQARPSARPSFQRAIAPSSRHPARLPAFTRMEYTYGVLARHIPARPSPSASPSASRSSARPRHQPAKPARPPLPSQPGSAQPLQVAEAVVGEQQLALPVRLEVGMVRHEAAHGRQRPGPAKPAGGVASEAQLHWVGSTRGSCTASPSSQPCLSSSGSPLATWTSWCPG